MIETRFYVTRHYSGLSGLIRVQFEAQVNLETDYDDQGFYLGWSHYRMCKAVIDDERVVFYDVVKSTTYWGSQVRLMSMVLTKDRLNFSRIEVDISTLKILGFLI